MPYTLPVAYKDLEAYAWKVANTMSRGKSAFGPEDLMQEFYLRSLKDKYIGRRQVKFGMIDAIRKFEHSRRIRPVKFLNLDDIEESRLKVHPVFGDFIERETLQKALKTLKKTERDAVLMDYDEARTIAKREGLSTAAIYHRRIRGEKKLKRIIGEKINKATLREEA